MRYYKPSVGRDHIPDPYKWVDVWAPRIIMAVAFSILGAVMFI